MDGILDMTGFGLAQIKREGAIVCIDPEDERRQAHIPQEVRRAIYLEEQAIEARRFKNRLRRLYWRIMYFLFKATPGSGVCP